MINEQKRKILSILRENDFHMIVAQDEGNKPAENACANFFSGFINFRRRSRRIN
ncbi:hypothetical protein ACSVDA_15670 [Cytobacillus sp. Hm23]